MKNQLLLIAILGMVAWSCSTPNISPEKKEELLSTDYWTNSSETNAALYRAAKIMVEITKNTEVRSEIISYHSDITDGEVFVSFDELFNSAQQPRYKDSFAILFKEVLDEKIRKGRLSEKSTDSLVLFLQQNFAIYAPYLAENFPDTQAPLTISWWDGIDTTGITPGIIEEAVSGRSTGLIPINDSYAAINPTLVIVPLENNECEIMQRCTGSGNNNSNSGGTVTYTPRSIDCRELKEDDKIRIDMPYFRLIGNLRPWPNRNFLALATVVGEFSYGENGLPKPAANTNFPWEDKWVSRKSAKNKTWMPSGISFIQSDWSKSEIELRIAVAYKKNKSDATFTGTVGIDESGDFTANLSAEYKFTIGGKARLFDVGFDRCVFLADHSTDTGFGLKDGLTVYRFGSRPMEFVLRPDFK